MAIGIVSLAAFAPRDPLAGAPLAPAKSPRMAGDGTSSILDGLATVLAVAGYFVGTLLWFGWGRENHLPLLRGFAYWLILIAALLLETTVHECGHALVGIAFDMRLRIFIVGPFQWRIRDGRWTFQFNIAKLFFSGGAAGVVSANPAQPRWHEICMIAAGPLASLFTGLVALVAVITAPGSSYEQAWEFLAMVSTFGLVAFAVNLIPFKPESLYSDGARIYQLLSGGPWSDLHRALSIVRSTLVTPLRPRDYDIAAIQRASLSFARGRQALLLRMFASSHFLDSGKLHEARESFAQAESIYHESASDIPVELYTAFVFDSAYLRQDAPAARFWWDLMESKKPTHLGVDYWLARSALFWIENHPQEAREAWNKTNTLAQNLPSAGTYEFDRYLVGLLGAALDRPLATIQQA
ncbi:MAG: M50 family metallopeptidase [Terracidiphilus sp.]